MNDVLAWQARWQALSCHPFVSQQAAHHRDFAQTLLALIAEHPTWDARHKQQMVFWAQQHLEMVSPDHSLWAHPEWMDTLDLGRGAWHAWQDSLSGRGPKTSDPSHFQVGRDVASTPGAVVFQNRLLQLIQYPCVPNAYARPLVMIPSWINKYYILDLEPSCSLVRWAQAQGHAVFVVSWVNPDPNLRDLTWGDYVTEGVLTACDVVRAITGARDVNALGFCMGGTALACALAYAAAHRRYPVHSATYLATLLDFSQPGDLGLFVEPTAWDGLQQAVKQAGLLDGRWLAWVFKSLRGSRPLWSAGINRYMLGREPEPSAVAYWNDDITHLPATMAMEYLHHTYLHNRLVQPGAWCVQGTPLDVQGVRTPSYWLATERDPIAPWRSVYASAQHHSVERFVLGGGGHVAGVIHDPAANTHRHLTGPVASSPDAWHHGSVSHTRSWWHDWGAWLGSHAGARSRKHAAVSATHPMLQPAPGDYVQHTI